MLLLRSSRVLAFWGHSFIDNVVPREIRVNVDQASKFLHGCITNILQNRIISSQRNAVLTHAPDKRGRLREIKWEGSRDLRLKGLSEESFNLGEN